VSNERQILIVGGGIAGLALALALARLGRAAIVLESRPRFETAGAGIQLGANGVRVLQRLGVAAALTGAVGTPEAIDVFDGPSAARLARLPLGAWFAARHGAPYWTMHRGDLNRVLWQAAANEPSILLRPGFALASVRQEAGGVVATDGGGASVAGSALVGADGLWSTVRQTLLPSAAPQFAGATAARTVLTAGQAGSLAAPHVGLWLGPGANVVHYPVRGGSEIAIVIIVRQDWRASGWDTRVDTARVLAPIAGFHASLTEVLSRAGDYRQWSLYRLSGLPYWSKGRVGLIGDAAHPVLPHLAQGGALALEDALLLARLLDRVPGDVAASLRQFERERRARAAAVETLSRRNGRLYHLSPPWSWARNGLLRLLPGAWLMAGYDNLYGWQPH